MKYTVIFSSGALYYIILKPQLKIGIFKTGILIFFQKVEF
jgi:hypothetical protein